MSSIFSRLEKCLAEVCVITEKLTGLSLCWNSEPTLNLKDHELLTEAWSRIQLSQLSTKPLKWGQDQFLFQVFFFHPSCIVKECNREKRRRHNHSAITELLIVYNFWLRAFEDTRQCSLNLYDTLTIINLCSCFALFAGSWGFLSIFTSLKQEMHKWTGWWSRGGLLEKL